MRSLKPHSTALLSNAVYLRLCLAQESVHVAEMERSAGGLMEALETMEETFLCGVGNGPSYLCGDRCSLADLSAACELETLGSPYHSQPSPALLPCSPRPSPPTIFPSLPPYLLLSLPSPSLATLPPFPLSLPFQLSLSPHPSSSFPLHSFH